MGYEKERKFMNKKGYNLERLTYLTMVLSLVMKIIEHQA
jgi:hypothetical protein